MSSRAYYLLKSRPEIPSAIVSDAMTSDEQFQNKTLRPIIKLQNDLFIQVFKNYIKKRKYSFYDLNLEQRYSYVENAIQKDTKFRNSLKGMVIGQFTLEEYVIYIENSSALNKRMMNIVIERLKDQIQLFEYEIAN